jgi:uncharacterized membrane protein
MHSLLHGVPWIHLGPAGLAALVAFWYLRSQNIYLKGLLGVLWLLLLPNTIYVLTDFEHLTHQISGAGLGRQFLLIVQYAVLEALGLIAYLFAMLPFEQFVRDHRLTRRQQMIGIVALNFLVACGMVLGKVSQVNSYVVFTHPWAVLVSMGQILTSVSLLGLVLLFAVACDGFYLLCRRLWLSKSGRLL